MRSLPETFSTQSVRLEVGKSLYRAPHCLHTPRQQCQWLLRRLSPQLLRREHQHQLLSASKWKYSFKLCQAQAKEAAEVLTVEPKQKLTSFQQLASSKKRQYVMISGKGGVGKTSLAASLACQLAAEGHNTLVVSTDPAHSLSDSLDQDVSGGKPVQVAGTDLPVWGMEIDADEARRRFQATSPGEKSKGSKDFLKGMGLGMIADQLGDLKLGELLNTPPPGLDEAVAIAKVVEIVKSEEYAKFSRIIFDTAPTGHTLRLLTVPDFVENSLNKIIRLRKKLSSAGSALRGLFGASEQQDAAVERLERLKESVIMVRDLFRDKDANEFIIATIPTVLAVKESARLLQALRKEQIPCHRIIVNQVIGTGMGEAYLKLKFGDQRRALQMVSADPQLQGLKLLKSPLVDLEVRGVPALQYFGNLVWGPVLEEYTAAKERQYYLLGGKGGVGKTSTSAALGVQLAQAGERTLVVSTDPAHSLSDSLDQDVSGGKPVMVEGTDGQLWGMEVDIEAAKAELREISAKDNGQGVSKFLNSIGLGSFAGQLEDLRLGELLETLPPGVDEAVAISKVVQLARSPEYAGFTRVIFDTAPTGHTLRLLTLPEFLDATIGKVVRLRQKLVDAADTIKGFFGAKQEQDSAVQKLEALRARTEETRALFRDPKSTQFVIVTIPTVMAVAESARLASALQAESVPVKTIVVNQIVPESAAQNFLDQRRKDQQKALQLLRDTPSLQELELTEGPLVDLEVRGVPALRYFGSQIWK